MELVITSHLPQTNYLSMMELDTNMASWLTNWPMIPLESTDVVSILVMRDPIARTLSKYKPSLTEKPPYRRCKQKHPDTGITPETAVQPTGDSGVDWNFDNYALRMLAGWNRMEPPRKITREHFIAAKATLDRFSVVLDQECLAAGIAKLSGLLGVHDHYHPAPIGGDVKETIKDRPSTPPRELCGDDTTYHALVEMNTLGIELYEYAKSISLVSCATA